MLKSNPSQLQLQLQLQLPVPVPVPVQVTFPIIYNTRISQVVVNFDPPIVKKTFIFKNAWIPSGDTTYVYGHLTTELFILNLLDGTKGFPKLLDFVCESDKKFTLVMDYLGKRIKKCTQPSTALKIFFKIAEKLAILHQHHIVHCDLKPDNILIDTNGNVSIIDFTHSYMTANYSSLDWKGRPSHHLQTLEMPEVPGTHAYVAPETYIKDSTKTTALDIWSLGCILYELITGYCLFDPTMNILEDQKPTLELLPQDSPSQNAEENYFQTIKDQHTTEGMINIMTKINLLGPRERDLIKRMLNIDPSQRPTAQELIWGAKPPMTPQEVISGEALMPPIFEHQLPESCQINRSLLHCFHFPWSLSFYVDQLVDLILGEDFLLPVPLKEQGYDRYDVIIIAHVIIANVFCNKWFYQPYNTLGGCKEYMGLLSYLVKNYHLSRTFLLI